MYFSVYSGLSIDLHVHRQGPFNELRTLWWISGRVAWFSLYWPCCKLTRYLAGGQGDTLSSLSPVGTRVVCNFIFFQCLFSSWIKLHIALLMDNNIRRIAELPLPAFTFGFSHHNVYYLPSQSCQYRNCSSLCTRQWVIFASPMCFIAVHVCLTISSFAKHTASQLRLTTACPQPDLRCFCCVSPISHPLLLRLYLHQL